MTKKIYIFSGLGVDERVFQKLELSGISVTHIKWIVPQKKETIENYATRLISQITTAEPILMGLSFGGIMAVEVSKQIDYAKVILIASAKTRREIPFYFRFAGKIGLYKLLPVQLLKKSNSITNWFFGTTSLFDRQLLKQILLDTDPAFLKWAIEKIARWKNLVPPKKVFHIHGTCDRILPFYFVNCDLGIKGGGHLMTINKASELSKIIKSQL